MAKNKNDKKPPFPIKPKGAGAKTTAVPGGPQKKGGVPVRAAGRGGTKGGIVSVRKAAKNPGGKGKAR